MTANELKLFEAGEKITADETNDNNRYLLGVAQDTSGELQNYVDTQLESFQTSLNTQISSINTQISAVNALANSKISATQSLSGGSGYCRLSNGLLLQWGWVSGMGNGTVKTVTLPTAYTTGYVVVGAGTYEQTRGDKGSTWRAYDTGNLSWFHIQSHFEQWSANVMWLTIGA